MTMLFSSTEMKAWDEFTISEQGITSLELMERAASLVFQELRTNFSRTKRFVVFCGTGNNGGDGLVIARLLREYGWQVRVFLVGMPEHCSPDNRSNQLRLPGELKLIREEEQFPEIIENEIIIDALFGIGLNRPAGGIFAFCIEHINRSENQVISIDCPSGLQCDLLDQAENSPIIRASETFTFQVPKRAFFRGKGLENTGKLKILDIGLDPGFLNDAVSACFYLDPVVVRQLLQKRNITAEKRAFGSALIIGGSSGMIGSVCLATEACLRSGAGLVTVLAPRCGYEILQTNVPEAMVVESHDDRHLKELPDLSSFSHLAIGPGLGRHADSVSFLDRLLTLNRPLVLDADALNIIAQEGWQDRIPKSSVITPHQREFCRMFGQVEGEEHTFQLQLTKARELEISIVLKGPFTRIILPNGRTFYNSTGNPGMAKGGSGDVLSGMIVGLWARLQNPEDAVLCAVFLHGLAGDLAAEELGFESILARDLLQKIAPAFKSIS